MAEEIQEVVTEEGEESNMFNTILILLLVLSIFSHMRKDNRIESLERMDVERGKDLEFYKKLSNKYKRAYEKTYKNLIKQK